MNHHSSKTYFMAFVLIVCINGCAPYAAMQTPVTQAEGTTGILLGSSIPSWYEGDGVSILYALTTSVRRGIGPRTDMGIRFGMTEGITWDIKYELVQSIISISGDVGASLSLFGVSLQPMIIAGSENVYGGIRYVINGHGENSWKGQSTVIGFSYGRKLQFFGEVNLYEEFYFIGTGIRWSP